MKKTYGGLSDNRHCEPRRGEAIFLLRLLRSLRSLAMTIIERPHRGIYFFGGLILLLTLAGCNEDSQVTYDSSKAKFVMPLGRNYNYSDILVTRAVDGDTLLLESGERVRLIGIDTPEMHESNKLYRDAQRTKQDVSTIQKLGRQAYEFTKNLVEGKRVSLEFDVEKYDRYKRLLAYVYLKDGTFVNAKIVEEGYASLMTYPPNVKYADEFVRLHRQARENKKGLWK